MTCFEKFMPQPLEAKSRRAQLEAEGWQRQFTADPTRLGEMVEFYQSLGFEVHLETACEEMPLQECASCFQQFCDQYKTIFVRRA
jgi:hypothetical protein